MAVAGVPDAPKHPMIWMLAEDQLPVTVADDDPYPSEELGRLLSRMLAVFFDDIKDVAPELAALKPRAKKAGGNKSLN
jgi:hypothetical protein